VAVSPAHAQCDHVSVQFCRAGSEAAGTPQPSGYPFLAKLNRQ
jgi:hypothetical protein